MLTELRRCQAPYMLPVTHLPLCRLAVCLGTHSWEAVALAWEPRLGESSSPAQTQVCSSPCSKPSMLGELGQMT